MQTGSSSPLDLPTNMYVPLRPPSPTCLQIPPFRQPAGSQTWPALGQPHVCAKPAPDGVEIHSGQPSRPWTKWRAPEPGLQLDLSGRPWAPKRGAPAARATEAARVIGLPLGFRPLVFGPLVFELPGFEADQLRTAKLQTVFGWPSSGRRRGSRHGQGPETLALAEAAGGSIVDAGAGGLWRHRATHTQVQASATTKRRKPARSGKWSVRPVAHSSERLIKMI